MKWIFKRKMKYKVGDVFKFELESGLWGIGRIIKICVETVFVEVFKIKPFTDIKQIDLTKLDTEKILIMEWCYDTGLDNGMWEIINNIAVDKNFEMPYFGTTSSDGKYYLIKGGDTARGIGDPIEVSKEEAQKAYLFGISNEIVLPLRCIDRFKELNMI